MKRKNKIAYIVLAAFVASFWALFLAVMSKSIVIAPSGFVALQQRNLILFTLALSLLVIVPVFIMLFVFGWKYRESNTKATYSPEWNTNKSLEAVWWGIPIAIITVLSVVTWQSSHALDPFRPLESSVKPVKVQVVALQWKWLFLYPEQNIATVNYLQIPKNTPINFEITADAPMNSFWIPGLGGQIYAMNGMTTKLHLIADKQGSFYGSSANLSGEGFAGMKFIVDATSENDFKKWTSFVAGSGGILDEETYEKLAEPSENNPQQQYASYQKDLYDTIMHKYMAHDSHGMNKESGGSH